MVKKMTGRLAFILGITDICKSYDKADEYSVLVARLQLNPVSRFAVPCLHEKSTVR